MVFTPGPSAVIPGWLFLVFFRVFVGIGNAGIFTIDLPANASTPFPLVQLSSNALLPVAATQSCSPVHHPSNACCGQIPIEPAATAAAH
jgi:hypothetical protein